MFLPKPVDAKTSQDRVVRRDVLDLLAQAGVGWASEAQARIQGSHFVECLGSLLWTITEQWDKLEHRACVPSEYWVAFKNRRVYNKHRPVAIDDDSTEGACFH